MKGNLAKVLNQWVFDDEGDDFEVRDTEPGGAVKLGVSFDALTRYWALTKHQVPIFNDLKNLTREGAVPIYDLLYWQPMRGDDFHSGIDYALFDPVMNSGLTGGIQILQTAVGVLPDGHLTSDLVISVGMMDPNIVIDNICDARIIHMRLKNTWSVNRRGWLARVERVRSRAKSMLQGS